MSQNTTKEENEGKAPLVCTYKDCKELQADDGEFCKVHSDFKKYKVEFVRKTIYVVDVWAKSEEEAKEKAKPAWEDIKDNGVEHYHLSDEEVEDIGIIYDVTHTDDPFNPEN